MVLSLSRRVGAKLGVEGVGGACSCHLDNKKQMSQLSCTDRLSQAYSTWPSLPLGSACVIFIFSPVLDALTICPPHLNTTFLFSPLLLSSPCLALFVCISPSISVLVLLLTMCTLTYVPLFAVWSSLSGVWGRRVCVCVCVFGGAEQRPVQLQVTPCHVWSADILVTLRGHL